MWLTAHDRFIAKMLLVIHIAIINIFYTVIIVIMFMYYDL